MPKIFIILGIVALIFFAGSAAARTTSINLSAGPVAEGQRELDHATAEQIQSGTESQAASDAQTLADQKLLDEKTRQERIDKIIAQQKAWATIAATFKVFGSIALAMVLILGSMNAMAYFGISNYRVAIKPVVNQVGAQQWATLPFFPFMLIHTSDDAPGYSTMFIPGKDPRLTQPQDMHLLALARMLDQPGAQNRAHLVPLFGQLSQMLEGIPRRQLTDRTSDDD